MDWVMDVLRAVGVLGIPVAVLTFVVVWWAVQRGVFDGLEDEGGIEKQIEALGKARKQRKKDGVKVRQRDVVHEKWMTFGGGFYGMTALYTWIRIEWADVLNLFGDLADLVFRLDVGVLVEFFVESIMNFVAAIAWPMYWMSNAGGVPIWMLFFVAYGGYWLGLWGADRATPSVDVIDFGGGDDEDEPG